MEAKVNIWSADDKVLMHGNKNIIILTKKISPAAPKVIDMTKFSIDVVFILSINVGTRGPSQ